MGATGHIVADPQVVGWRARRHSDGVSGDFMLAWLRC
jgi:hypothetical protein